LVLPNTPDRETATAIAAKIMTALEDPFVLDEVAGEITLDVEASIGIVLSPED
jgi:GGDEF domain-containing protein